MKYAIIAGAALLILIISIIIGYKMPTKEKGELSEKDKTLKAIRILIYIIIGLILSGIVLKLLFIYGILSLSKL
jgi:hypothetical protein